jgi:hypothetical protein
MPIEIDYVQGRKGAVFAGSGRLKGAEFLAASDEAFARDFATDPLHYILFDADDADAVDVTGQDMRELARRDIEVSRRLPGLVVAIYAHEALAFGLARMWQAYVEQSGWTTAVFRDRQEAVNWLKKEVAARTGTAVDIP